MDQSFRKRGSKGPKSKGSAEKFHSTFDVDFSTLGTFDTNDELWVQIRNNVENLFTGQQLLDPLEVLSEKVKELLDLKTLMHSMMVKSLVTLLTVQLQSYWRDEIAAASLNRFYELLRDRWLSYFGTILPYIQGIFLPLDRKLASRQNSMTVQKIGLAAFRDGLLLSEPVKRKLIRAIEVKGTTLLPRILQMVEVIKRIQTSDQNETELHEIFAKTGI